ncbi:hypothetical protein H261_17533 [Paramagnetospirillum caucaseum]|uniref:Uncharacterized protein n=1 Tax=Paramagnetospirillum caucaseum TaxID=1244869 RepID=M3A820_9PROT|nr:hypothetical protein [Paramagnetospirillum caucaseum]EME68624.1 hypothetical protein H261_17533 [Paramagnetospirillum caucaseum]
MEPTDTLGQWMAHYLAERLQDAEKAAGPEKASLERELFDLILQLWKHRGNIPGHRRPFRETDDLADKLRTLIDRSRPWYFDPDARGASHSSGGWIDKARTVDRTARDLIGCCIKHAVAETSGEDAAWADDSVAQQLDDGEDARLARVLFTDVKILFEGETPQRRGLELKRLRDGIDALLEVASGIRQELDIEITATEQSAEAEPDGGTA